MKIIKKNKYFILSILLTLGIIMFSFYEFYNLYFSYTGNYYKIKEICYEKGELDNEMCKYFRNTSDVERYLKNNDPKENWKKYDVLTITYTIVETTVFSGIQFFSPLIIIISVIGTLHDEYSSGMFENYLLRMNYKDYIKSKYKIVLKSSLITPLALLFIFLVSCIATNFNFNISNVDKQLAVYSDFKYNHFIIYGTLILFIQFFISWFYANIAVFFTKKHNNKLVAIVMAYVGFLIIDLLIYLIIYCLILNKIFGIKELTDYFNITGYWFFDTRKDCLIVLMFSIILQFISTILIRYFYKNKNGVITSYEKQTS